MKVITSIGPSSPSSPANGLVVAPGSNATARSAFDGARRFFALTPLPTPNVTTLQPVALHAVVSTGRFVRVVFERPDPE